MGLGRPPHPSPGSRCRAWSSATDGKTVLPTPTHTLCALLLTLQGVWRWALGCGCQAEACSHEGLFLQEPAQPFQPPTSPQGTCPEKGQHRLVCRVPDVPSQPTPSEEVWAFSSCLWPLPSTLGIFEASEVTGQGCGEAAPGGLLACYSWGHSLAGTWASCSAGPQLGLSPSLRTSVPAEGSSEVPSPSSSVTCGGAQVADPPKRTSAASVVMGKVPDGGSQGEEGRATCSVARGPRPRTQG